MLTVEDVYIMFRRAQARAYNRPYRLPKDFNQWLARSKSNIRENLETITKFFNTKWQNINPEDYFSIGFSLWKKFSYHQFLNPLIIRAYVERDKLKKRTTIGCKADILRSLKFIKNTYGDISLKEYSNIWDGKIRQPVTDFLKNKIGKYIIAYMINKKYLILEDNERGLLSIIVNNYRNILSEMEDIMEKIDETIKHSGKKLWKDDETTSEGVSAKEFLKSNEYPQVIKEKYKLENLNEDVEIDR